MEPISLELLEELIVGLNKIFGKDVWDDGVTNTATRWIKAMQEFKPEADIDFNVTTFPAKVNQMIAVSNIEFSSLCSHHLFPFLGKAHVAYIPNELQIGLSKIPRIVHHFATRPQVQEKLTEQVATFLKSQTKAHGVAVVVEATHTCMSARGIREHNGIMRTSEMRGVFLSNPAARDEFFSLVGMR